PRHQFVDGGQRQLEEAPQLIAVEIRPAVADLQELIEVLIEKALVQRVRVERLVGGIGREENRLLAEQRRGVRRDRRFPDAALTAEENYSPRCQRAQLVIDHRSFSLSRA